MKEELEELFQLKRSIESKAFQTYLMKPIYTELENLKVAYDCKTLEELATLKGKKEGLSFFISLLKQIEVDIKNMKYHLESQE